MYMKNRRNSSENAMCGLKCERIFDVVNGFSISKINPLQHRHF